MPPGPRLTLAPLLEPTSQRWDRLSCHLGQDAPDADRDNAGDDDDDDDI